MLTRQEKEKIIGDVADALRERRAAFFVDYRGVNTAQMRELRRTLRAAGGKLRILRKTLLERALRASELAQDVPAELLEGQIGVVYGFSELTGVAKAISDFRRVLEDAVGPDVPFTVRGGILESRTLTRMEVEALAAIPPREVLLAMLAGALRAPIVGIAWMLAAPQRALLSLLQQKVGQSS